IYPDYVIKYISYTSIILSPYCDSFTSSTNTSLYSYSDVYIKKSNLINNYFKSISSLFKSLIGTKTSNTDQSSINRQQDEVQTVQTISFIVPFPQICVYKNHKNNDNNNH